MLTSRYAVESRMYCPLYDGEKMEAVIGFEPMIRRYEGRGFPTNLNCHGASVRIRTANLLIRNQLLSPVELQMRNWRGLSGSNRFRKVLETRMRPLHLTP